MLPVNNSLVRHVGLLLSGRVTHYRSIYTGCVHFRWINIVTSCKPFEYSYLMAVFNPLHNWYLKTFSFEQLKAMLEVKGTVKEKINETALKG